MPVAKKNPVGRPRNPDSRPSQLRALKRGESICETHTSPDNEVPDTKRRLSNAFQKAIERARKDFPNREFSGCTEAGKASRANVVQVTITITRTK